MKLREETIGLINEIYEMRHKLLDYLEKLDEMIKEDTGGIIGVCAYVDNHTQLHHYRNSCNSSEALNVVKQIADKHRVNYSWTYEDVNDCYNLEIDKNNFSIIIDKETEDEDQPEISSVV